MNSKYIVRSILAALLLLPVLTQAEEPFRADQTFGEALPGGATAVSLKQAIASLNGQSEATVTVMGEVTEVCQAKGCWMILVDGDTYARITFKDYGFFVPIETSMQRTVVHGLLTEHLLSEQQVEHYAEDAGAHSTLSHAGSAEQGEQGSAQEVREYSLVASAVALEDRS